jgi:archaellum component FlaC
MEEMGLHSGLEIRLKALAMRIARLKQDIGQAKGLAKIVDGGEIERLEQRYKTLEDQLHKLDREGSGFRQDMKAEIEKRVDDLTGTLENFVMRLDSQNLLDQRPKGPRKP